MLMRSRPRAEIYATGRANLPGSTRERDMLGSFARMLPELLRQRLAEEVLLGRLGKDGVVSIFAGRAGSKPPAELIDLVFTETEGNPFFVEEVFRLHNKNYHL